MAASYREWLQVLREPEKEGSVEEGGDGLWSKEEVDEWPSRSTRNGRQTRRRRGSDSSDSSSESSCEESEEAQS